MRFAPGATVVRRYIHPHGAIGWVLAVTVVSDDKEGLLTWTRPGDAVARRVTLDGVPTRNLPFEEKFFQPSVHEITTWHDHSVLMFSPAGTAWSVWWFFDAEGGFTGWYVNLETPERRWDGGRDCIDQALDVVIAPDRTWRWKDEDEFADYTGRHGYWEGDDAADIRGEGEMLIGRAEAGQFPFDGTWCDFVPDPAWKPTSLPWWWDQAPDVEGFPRPIIHPNG